MRSALLALAFLTLPTAATAQPPGKGDTKKDDIPRGEVQEFTFDQSRVFPGTVRKVTLYIPRQYDGKTPACVYVNQDGVQFKATEVFDRLIHEKAMPVTIGVFVRPGEVPPPRPGALIRYNRSFEYDGLGDAYARFLLDELLPAVEKRRAADGRPIVLSKKGTDRAIGGASSGAICAFTVAWERPDAFTRVFSAVGTFVGLRGGNNYPTLIRKYEPKPIRVFLQDGENDNNAYGGDWWMANQEMERSLRFAGYEVEHAWDKGPHSGAGGTKVFPDAMRFLWKGWPAAPKAGTGSKQLQDLLIPGEGWELVGSGYKFTEGPAVNAKGEVFFNDVGNSKTYKVGSDGKPAVYIEDSSRGDGQAFGPDGRLYANAAGANGVVAYDGPGKRKVIADGFRGNDLVVNAKGEVYLTDPFTTPNRSNVIFISAKGEKRVADVGLRFANGITLSPDQTLLYVADYASHWVYSYQVQPNGSLAKKQRYFHLHAPDTADDAGADGMRTDHDGRLWVATRLGLQVCDQAGRVNCIIPTPNGKVSNLTFGGPKYDVLYATCGDRVYKRKVKVTGTNAYQAPFTPRKPKL